MSDDNPMGLTKRQYYAAQALPAVIAAHVAVHKELGSGSWYDPNAAAREAFDCADALIFAEAGEITHNV